MTSAEGIGFAVPINTVKDIIQSFKQTGKFEEAYLGIFAYDKNVIPYLEENLKINNGIYVVQITKNSPADKCGLKEKDILLEIDEKPLEKMCDLRCYIYTKKPGDEVTLKVLRSNREHEIKVILSKKM
ncbi:MAG: PDZ domain-containing protein [Clostridia bacterium]|nr:PDZ domain-containing protein [Clostridia bacterium]